MEKTKEQISEDEQKAYSRACTEVLEILKDAPIEDIAKVPKELLDALESKKDKDYIFETNSYMSFENEDISDIARVILMQIFKDYIIKSPETSINENTTNDIEKMEDDIEESKTQEFALVEVKKESIYQKIINFFKKIFSFRKTTLETEEE